MQNDSRKHRACSSVRGGSVITQAVDSRRVSLSVSAQEYKNIGADGAQGLGYALSQGLLVNLVVLNLVRA